MIQRRKVIIGTLGVAAAAGTAAVAGCSSSKGSSSAAAGAGDAATVWTEPVANNEAPAPVQLTVTPADKATGIALTKPITVAAQNGTVQSVAVTAGKTKIDGSLQADGTWKSSEDLAYDKTYKVVVTTADSVGATATQTTTFSTIDPKHVIKVNFQANAMTSLKSGHTYGAGQPVIIAFNRAVDKEKAEKAIEITTSPSVEGKFYWASSSIVHWRPAKYWAKGTTVKVNVNVLGVHLGSGVYGSADARTHFTIGRALQAITDTSTHRTKVYIDGKMVRSMACSTGRGGYTKGANGQEIHFWTQAGPHVVLSKEKTHTMSSASYGLSDPSNPYYYAPETVRLCTRISYSGEFLHAAPWNHSLGQANLSHGCVNLSTADAQWVYDNFLIGDVVDVRHSPKHLPMWDGLGDWTVSYDKYGK
jgi:lipoprotein-anchoring transpeptidase ErfK/SrfK